MTQSLRLRRRPPLLALQLVVLLGSTFALAAPPAQGAMLLVPLSASAERRMLPAAFDEATSVVGAGPVAGSLVVRGERARLLGRLARLGVVVLAAPPAGCAGAGARR